ncbi:cysteine-rich secretory family protein [Treponema socranskii subsp. socranskii VPI DR56BR1116 = ATCC 35536]|uniref:Cysteine-rich secretory family protein n=1 Tax=Treponema socranskii subsp. socranskii VPI DR56BR1116 = ATCC 35536 TaxID=1125725 RepID=U1F5Z8_TRESO|nr:CAP domain-containing protein [Treponema socranskii]ERF59387.1 cysteine-rich secretory family protein [Treponema socranskii subsp. socranskii VPI DR56BR1116 = ATCC 35536]ERK01188.1 cysteine-rich secretory family protein [Treponema socranskii subsp. socranskii VPI DR56BR1116 = ATCC 35536]
MKNPKTKHIVKIIKMSAAALLLAVISVSCGNMAEDPNAAYFAKLENDVLDEINKARTNPKEYAEKYLVPYVENGNASEAMKECIIEMKNTKALKALQPSKKLTLAAKEWVNVQGPGGGVGHGNTGERIHKQGLYPHTWSENISYGYNDARKIVIQLLEDDKVPGREHRKTILSRAYTHVGIGCGPHKIYNFMCVQDFAG